MSQELQTAVKKTHMAPELMEIRVLVKDKQKMN